MDPESHGSGGGATALPARALEAVVAACPLPIISVDLDGCVTSWNPAAERLFGWREEEVLGRRLPVTPPDRQEEVYRLRTQTEAGRGVQDVEVVRQRRDGSLVTLSLSTAPLQDERGKLVGTMLTYMDLTERKAAEEALRQSQELWQRSFESAAIGKAVVTPSGRWLRVNPALCAMLGYSEEELLARRFQDITHPDDLEADLALVEQMLEGRIRSFQMEKRYFHQDGHIVWIQLSVTLVQDTEGRPHSLVSEIQDITARKEAEAALLASEEQLRTIFETAPIGVCILAVDGMIEHANEAFAQFFGYSASELSGRHHSTLVSAQQRSSIADELQDRFDRALVVRNEVELVHKDGAVVTLFTSATPVRGMDGEPRRVVFALDISERKRMEETLRQSEEQLRTLIDQAPVGICVVTDDGIFEQVNEAYSRMLGYEPHEMFGRHFSIVTPADQLAATEALRRRLMEERRSSLMESEMVRKDGRVVTILSTTIPLIGVDGAQRRVSFGIDITERKEAERALEHRASHDALTGLANRVLLQHRLDQALVQSRRRGGVAAVLFVDLDGFKHVNDRLGHDAGDALLKRVAQQLVGSVRSSDTVARLAGDEFIVVLPDVGSGHNAVAVAAKMLESLQLTEDDGGRGGISASIGISLYPFDGGTGEELLTRADEAMYCAKRRGKNTYAVWGEEHAP